MFLGRFEWIIMNGMRLLIVEGDRKVRAFLEKGLREEHYAVDSCATGPEALDLIGLHPLERLIANLVDNAVRFTPPGGRVDVTVDREDRAGRLVVADTGIGIPPESIPVIFDRFSVVDASRSKDTGGVGLGLSIAKRVADIHEASIEVLSRVGEGTRFIVRFPPGCHPRRPRKSKYLSLP